MKKFLSLMLALLMVMSLSTVAWAEKPDVNPTFKVKYTTNYTGTTTSNPKETFTFKFTEGTVVEANAADLDAPAIPNATVDFAANSAAAADSAQEVEVTVNLSKVTWPSVGIYTYTVSQVPGSTAGVTYDTTSYKMKVTVAYDEGTDTYYTAFITMTLVDGDGDGVPGDGATADKTAGTFTNTYSAADLAVSKLVTGNMGDKSAYFEVDVTVSEPVDTADTYPTSFAVSGGSEQSNPTTITAGASTTFKLKDGETINIKNLPYGMNYTVAEKDYTVEPYGYDKAKYKVNNEDPVEVSGTGAVDAAAEAVVITNNKGVQVDTGITLDSLPYILLLGLAVVGLVLFAVKRRSNEA